MRKTAELRVEWSDWLTFVVPGEPRGKGRPRFGRTRAGAPVTFTDARTASYENLVRLAAAQAREAAGLCGEILDGPIIVTLTAFCARPKSAPRAKLLPTSRPDIDNVVKAVLDGASILWRDDARIIELRAKKLYASDGDGGPRVEVEVMKGEIVEVADP